VCPINGTKVWRAVVSGSVDGSALATQTSAALGPLCP